MLKIRPGFIRGLIDLSREFDHRVENADDNPTHVPKRVLTSSGTTIECLPHLLIIVQILARRLHVILVAQTRRESAFDGRRSRKEHLLIQFHVEQIHEHVHPIARVQQKYVLLGIDHVLVRIRTLIEHALYEVQNRPHCLAASSSIDQFTLFQQVDDEVDLLVARILLPFLVLGT